MSATEKVKRKAGRPKGSSPIAKLATADREPIAYSVRAALEEFRPKLNTEAFYAALRDGRLTAYQVTKSRAYVLRSALIKFVLTSPEATITGDDDHV